MLGCKVQGYKRACAPSVGGVGTLLVGDANDFNFTEASEGSDADVSGYATIQRRVGAVEGGGAYLFPVDSLSDSISVEMDITSDVEQGSTSYAYTVVARLSKMSQQLVTFNKKIDAAYQCCQLLIVWRNNDGAVFVAGEKYVNDQTIPPFRFRQDGGKIQTGKKFTEFNGQDLSLKADYLRAAYEFVGGFSAIEAMIAP
ncbi:MAG: hypothetical protein ACTHMM_17670 [Agriterribacter sp.]